MPASSTWAKAAERIGIFVETPPIFPFVALQPKSQPQLYQGTFTPCRYQLPPFHAIRCNDVGAIDVDTVECDPSDSCHTMTPPSRTTVAKKLSRRFAIAAPALQVL